MFLISRFKKLPIYSQNVQWNVLETKLTMEKILIFVSVVVKVDAKIIKQLRALISTVMELNILLFIEWVNNVYFALLASKI